MTHLSRRSLLAWLGSGAAGLALSGHARAQISPQSATPRPSFTGPGVNPYWNGVNPFVSYPQKLPLLRMTDRGIQLETPRPYFLTPFTPNAAFYVRYHLDLIPNAVDLSTWRLSLEGNVERPLQLSFDELVKNLKAGSVVADVHPRSPTERDESLCKASAVSVTARRISRCSPHSRVPRGRGW